VHVFINYFSCGCFARINCNAPAFFELYRRTWNFYTTNEWRCLSDLLANINSGVLVVIFFSLDKIRGCRLGLSHNKPTTTVDVHARLQMQQRTMDAYNFVCARCGMPTWAHPQEGLRGSWLTPPLRNLLEDLRESVSVPRTLRLLCQISRISIVWWTVINLSKENWPNVITRTQCGILGHNPPGSWIERTPGKVNK